MKESTLLKLALLCSLVGVAALFVISENTDLEERNIDSINEGDLYKKVKIRGTVSHIEEKNNILIVEIAEVKPITVVFFKEMDVELKEGDYVSVRGELREYKGKLELIGNEVDVE